MKYYVVADIHGFYDEFISALQTNGFFDDEEPHKLIVCGDLFDRGNQALKLQNFILDLLKKDQIILIKGNHEDLMEQLLNGWYKGSYFYPHHANNGTLDTVCQLTQCSVKDIFFNPQEAGQQLLKSPFLQTLIPSMKNYYETENYIFIHGWIPCNEVNNQFEALEDWRSATDKQWEKARWINGIEAAHQGIIEQNKTIICGHWHCSYGHAKYGKGGSEFDQDADFTPYHAEGIVALDACTAFSKTVNCIVVNDEECTQTTA